MLVRNYSTNVSGHSHRGDDLVVHLRSEINKVFDQITGSWPEFTSSDGMLVEKEEPLQLNFTETDDAIMIEAELSGFRPVEVDVSFQNQSMIIEACSDDVQNKNKSYYLGEYSQPDCRWTIPLGCAIEKDSIKKQFKDDTLFVSVLKPVGVTRLVAFESE